MQGIDQSQLQKFIVDALYEDVRDGDHTSLACIPSDQKTKARLLVKDIGVIAGIDFAKAVFKHVDPNSKIEQLIEDGSYVKPGDEAFYIEANSQALLKAERLVLNTMQRLSGISTLSQRFFTEIEGSKVKILDTRKTTPLMRFLEKWAVRIGGCHNYRDGLYDRIMIKDNHVDACGTIKDAILKTKKYLADNNKDLKITIEVRNLVELHEVLAVGQVDRIMLDNFELPILAEAVYTVDGKFETEASGGVNLKTVRKISKTGVDFISVGALTHSAGSLDLSLKVMK
ncbi:UNVERIFIED_CONTAM: hypothetical protein GTU68_036686 [Idotea baltica]|nr:hypothetical protein [Idotea baltica]